MRAGRVEGAAPYGNQRAGDPELCRGSCAGRDVRAVPKLGSGPRCRSCASLGVRAEEQGAAPKPWSGPANRSCAVVVERVVVLEGTVRYERAGIPEPRRDSGAGRRRWTCAVVDERVADPELCRWMGAGRATGAAPLFRNGSSRGSRPVVVERATPFESCLERGAGRSIGGVPCWVSGPVSRGVPRCRSEPYLVSRAVVGERAGARELCRQARAGRQPGAVPRQVSGPGSQSRAGVKEPPAIAAELRTVPWERAGRHGACRERRAGQCHGSRAGQQDRATEVRGCRSR
jgi:hypothetical protein